MKALKEKCVLYEYTSIILWHSIVEFTLLQWWYHGQCGKNQQSEKDREEEEEEEEEKQRPLLVSNCFNFDLQYSKGVRGVASKHKRLMNGLGERGRKRRGKESEGEEREKRLLRT